MNTHLKSILRRPAGSALLLILLASSICISSIGTSALDGANKQLATIESQYTTIAIPSGENQGKIEEAGLRTKIGMDSWRFSDGTRYIGPRDAEVTARESPDYLGIDHRVLLTACVEGGKPVSSGTMDPLQYNAMQDWFCYCLSVLALRCISVGETDFNWTDSRNYQATFELVDPVCRIDAYDLPPDGDTYYIQDFVCTRDGEVPFEAGKTYLVRGLYNDYDVREKFTLITDEDGTEKEGWVIARDTEGRSGHRRIRMNANPPMMNLPYTASVGSGYKNWQLERRKYPDSGEYYICTPEKDCWPYFAEYEGDWRDFLNTEDGSVWKDEIIPYVEKHHTSVPVILADNLYSMYYFNSGDATILDGSPFSEEDYAQGNPVCLISASYAQVNDLSVGDTIHLDFYNGGYEVTSFPITTSNGRKGTTFLRYFLNDRDRLDIQGDYKIVGIYTAPEWAGGAHSFHADTLFIPKANIPDADKYVGPSMAMLNSIMIRNGSIEDFEAHMAANDKAGAYLYFDQGYSEAIAPVQAMKENSMRVFAVGGAMFGLTMLLFLLLYSLRMKQVGRSMRLLGISVKKTWLESYGVLMIQVAAAVGLGNALAVGLYDRITGQLLEQVPPLSWAAIAVCAGVQVGLMALLGLAWTGMMARKNLMQRR